MTATADRSAMPHARYRTNGQGSGYTWGSYIEKTSARPAKSRAFCDIAMSRLLNHARLGGAAVRRRTADSKCWQSSPLSSITNGG